MVCYHPIKAFVIGKTLEGKKIFKFANKKQQDLEWMYLNGKYYYEYELLPCGHCIGCTMKRSRDWATRMVCELQYHDRACFITLTYSDENLPVSHYVDSNGEEQISYTLRKKDFQDFMKRLRKRFDAKIRYFACGEYGGKTRRPHYHAILFGVDFHEDRYAFGLTPEGHVQWRSPLLEDVWPYGYSMICEVNFKTCAYVSRYCTKKRYGSQNMYYQTFGLVPEFNLMSRRPGIGAQWFQDHGKEAFEKQAIYLTENDGGLKLRPPKYYDKLYDVLYPAEMEEIKAKRKEQAKRQLDVKLRQTDRNMYEMLAAEERNFLEKTAILRRDKV